MDKDLGDFFAELRRIGRSIKTKQTMAISPALEKEAVKRLSQNPTDPRPRKIARKDTSLPDSTTSQPQLPQDGLAETSAEIPAQNLAQGLPQVEANPQQAQVEGPLAENPAQIQDPVLTKGQTEKQAERKKATDRPQRLAKATALTKLSALGQKQRRRQDESTKKATTPGLKKTEEAATASASAKPASDQLEEMIARSPSGNSPAADDDIDMSDNLSGLRIILPYLERKRILLRQSYHMLWHLMEQALKGRYFPNQKRGIACGLRSIT